MIFNGLFDALRNSHFGRRKEKLSFEIREMRWVRRWSKDDLALFGLDLIYTAKRDENDNDDDGEFSYHFSLRAVGDEIRINAQADDKCFGLKFMVCWEQRLASFSTTTDGSFSS